MLKNKEVMTKTKHASLELPELEQPESPKKDSPKLKLSENAIWNKITTLGDSLKPKLNHNPPQNNDVTHKKSKAQTTLDYFLKSKPKDIIKSDKRQTISHPPRSCENGRPTSLQKQLSVGSYPILLKIPEESAITRDRPATVCGDKPGADKTLSLDSRPRKKLSFKDPEISGCSRLFVDKETNSIRSSIKAPYTPQMTRSLSVTENNLPRWSSYEDFDLEVNRLINIESLCKYHFVQMLK